MVIAKTASRNSIAAKAGDMSEAVLDAQASFITSDATGQEASSERDSLDDDDVERKQRPLTCLYLYSTLYFYL